MHPLAEPLVRPLLVSLVVCRGCAYGEVSRGGADPPVVGAVAVSVVGGGLGGVLGQVAGDLLRGSRLGPGRRCDGCCGPAVRRADGRTRGPGRSPRSSTPGTVEPHRGGRLAHQSASVSALSPCGAGANPSVVLRAVEAHQGVEVDDAAQLVLGDLGVLNGRDLASREAGTSRILATSRRRAMVNRRHRSGPTTATRLGGVVVAVARTVAGPARDLRRHAGAGRSGSAVATQRRSTRARVAATPSVTRPCTRPNEGAVRVANTSGFSATVTGTVLPPATPGADQVERVRGIEPRARGALVGATVPAPDVCQPERLGRAGVARTGPRRCAASTVCEVPWSRIGRAQFPTRDSASDQASKSGACSRSADLVLSVLR